jgi:hypothetical protein
MAVEKVPNRDVETKPPERIQHWKALQHFANLDDRDSWKEFRKRWPDFIPPWMYSPGDTWAKHQDGLQHHWGPPELRLVEFPYPLLPYRNALRAVWSRSDPRGVALRFLLGFDQDAEEKQVASDGPSPKEVARPPALQDEPEASDYGNMRPLPPGRPLIDGTTGLITWKFDLVFQQALYELMQERWRAMVCPVCGRFSVAAKTGSKYCSNGCANVMKRKRALDYFRSKGAARRTAKLKEQRRMRATRRRH